MDMAKSFMRSEAKPRRLVEAVQARRDGVEQVALAKLCSSMRVTRTRTHHGQFADDRGEPAADLQLRQQRRRHRGDRTRQHDHVERRFARQAAGAVGLARRCVAHTRATQVVGGEARQAGVDLERGDLRALCASSAAM